MKYATLNPDGSVAAFYDPAINAKIPQDARIITDTQWIEYLSDQNGKRFVNGEIVARGLSLSEARAAKIRKIEEMRIKKTEAGISFGGKTVPTDKAALVLLQAAQAFLGKNPTTTFKKAGMGEFNQAAIDGLVTAIGNMQRPIYAREADLYDEIMAAQSVEDIDQIDIESGW